MWNFCSFLAIANRIKHKHADTFLTNVYSIPVGDGTEVTLKESENSVVCWIDERFRKRLFFATVEIDDLVSLLSDVPSGVVIERIYNDPCGDELQDVFERSGFMKYASYVRITTCWNDNPYSIPLTGKSGVLARFYDPEFGVYADVSDIDELYELNKKTFDEKCDDVLTLREWETIVSEKRCLLFRDNEIESYYVWRPEGIKLYSNLSLNLGPANYLYNLERRIKEQYWNGGVRIFYSWKRENNKGALARDWPDDTVGIKWRHRIYNGVYLKI